MTSSLVSRRAVVAAAAGLAFGSGEAEADVRSVAILGDSITSGYGLPAHDALPARLQAELARIGAPARVIGAGVLGDTTAGGAARVDHAVPAGVDLCVVELGGNDFLHAAEPADIKANLQRIVRRLKARGVAVVLAGLKVPAMLNGPYAEGFNDAFTSVAVAERVTFLPDLLEGVVLNPELNQQDGVHPNAAGVARIAQRLAPLVARGLQAG
jgi:acyl-CoA thioesterase-1